MDLLYKAIEEFAGNNIIWFLYKQLFKISLWSNDLIDRDFSITVCSDRTRQ